ncbi:MAG: 3-oxoacyl-[acyl-carrier-protein] synthase [Actinomycetota bacterium]|jgi:3-oxoacyl-[acyl-carrier-protein] synthase-3|nr:3-oxoacyl-[acyl-carrier-protein] synthase [Actinomycetota bacterium]
MGVVVSGVGAALPATTVENDAFDGLGITDEWIVERTGVRRRHRLHPGERLVDLAAAAASDALRDAGVDASEVDFVVAATTTPDRVSPGLAPGIGHLIGARSPGTVDVNGACTGFLYALDYAISRISHGSADRILVVGADAMSRLTDPADRNTAVLFGDGAGAVLVEASRGASCDDCVPFLSFGSAAEYADALFVDHDDHVVRMDGAQVYASAVEAMTDEIGAALTAHEITQDDVDLLVCHQANSRILTAVVRRLKWNPERAASYVAQFGNTSSASIPLALWKAQTEGRLKRGHTVVLCAFGAGFTWGAGVIGWKACRHR